MSIRTRALVVALSLAVLVAPALWAQEGDQQQQLRIGTKTVPADVVAWQAFETPMADMATAAPASIGQAYQTVEEAGLTPIGPCYMVMTGDWPPQNNTFQWEVQIPIANDVSQQDYPAGGDVQVKTVPERLVAYTYHVGPMEQMNASFMRLFQWIGTAGLKMAGPVSIVVFEDPSMHPQGGLAELQIEVAKQ